jgi:non-specific serine/threonine protein kinase
VLGSLVDKGLLRVATDEPRYRMLETIREFALDQLAACGEEEQARDRLARYLLGVVDQAAVGLLGEEYPAWLDRLDLEHDNLRTALRWAIDRGDAGVALRFGAILWRFWPGRGHLVEGRAWLAEMLALPGPADPELHARALHGAGRLALEARDFPAARAALEECLGFWRERGDQRQIGDLLNDLGLLAFNQGDDEAARPRYRAALDAYRIAGAGPLAEGTVLNNLGLLAQRAGDLSEAQVQFIAALRLLRAAGAPWAVATVLRNLGRARREEQDYLGARDLCVESLDLARAMDDHGRIALCFYEFAALAAIWGQDERAWRLAAAAAALLEADGVLLAAPEEGWVEQQLAPIRQRLPERALAALWAEGQALSLDAAVALAQAVDPAPPPAAVAPPVALPTVALSRRERQVAELVARGLTNRQVADELFLSDRTIDSHVANILGKLSLGNRVQLAAWVVASGDLVVG